jgi:uncharacterized membrane protein (UPF0127 family)
MSARPHFLQPLLTAAGAGYVLVNTRTGSEVARDLELASDSRSRNKGLLGRDSLAAEAAMIIAPCNAVHTFFMRFSIDVVFADRQGRVVKVCHHLKPWRIGVGWGGFAAIELAAGAVDHGSVAAGDLLRVVERPPV